MVVLAGSLLAALALALGWGWHSHKRRKAAEARIIGFQRALNYSFRRHLSAGQRATVNTSVLRGAEEIARYRVDLGREPAFNLNLILATNIPHNECERFRQTLKELENGP